MGIAGGCGLFLLGNYGVQGNFSNDDEERYFGAVMILGGASLLVTAVWKGLVIRGEIRRDKENAAADVSEEPGPSQEGAQAQQDSPVTELATAFVSLGVLATTAETGFVIAEVSTGDAYYATASKAFLPISMVLYVISLFAQPMRQDPRAMIFLWAHFISFAWVSEGAYMFWGIREGDVGYVLLVLSRALLQTLVFHYGLKLRASIGRLPDKDLNNLDAESDAQEELPPAAAHEPTSSGSQDHPHLALMLHAMRDELPASICDSIQSVIDQVHTDELEKLSAQLHVLEPPRCWQLCARLGWPQPR